MAFVLDASITACWAFQDEDHPDAGLAFHRMRAEEAVVPCLWWFEVRNILVVNERRGRIGESDTAAFLLNLSRLRVRLDRLPEEDAVLRLADPPAVRIRCRLSGTGAAGGLASGDAGSRSSKGSGRGRGGATFPGRRRQKVERRPCSLADGNQTGRIRRILSQS